MHQFKELLIWKKSIALAKEIYLLCSELPTNEKFGLASQMQRCAVSIASNIAEGAGRNSNKEFAHFLSIAQGSIYELETQIILSNELNFISEKRKNDLLSITEEIQKMNYALQNKIKS